MTSTGNCAAMLLSTRLCNAVATRFSGNPMGKILLYLDVCIYLSINFFPEVLPLANEAINIASDACGVLVVGACSRPLPVTHVRLQRSENSAYTNNTVGLRANDCDYDMPSCFRNETHTHTRALTLRQPNNLARANALRLHGNTRLLGSAIESRLFGCSRLVMCCVAVLSMQHACIYSRYSCVSLSVSARARDE